MAGKVNQVSQEVGKTAEQIAEVRDGVKETISNVNERVDNRIAQIDEKIDSFKENLRAEVDRAIAPIDSNGDGKADFGEAIAHLKKNDNWKDPGAWLQTVIAVLGSLFGLYTVKKGGAPIGRAIVAKLHGAGRTELQKRGGKNPPESDSS